MKRLYLHLRGRSCETGADRIEKKRERLAKKRDALRERAAVFFDKLKAIAAEPSYGADE